LLKKFSKSILSYQVSNKFAHVKKRTFCELIFKSCRTTDKNHLSGILSGQNMNNMHNDYHKRCKSFLFSFLILSLSFLTRISAQDGEALFKANCTSCHAVKDKVVGPALQGIENRRPEEWLLKWVKNSQSVVKSGDEYAVKLFNDFNKVPMPNQNLKDDEIKAILAYIKKEAEKVETAPAPVAGTEPTEGTGKSNLTLYLLIAAVVLILIAGVLRRIMHTLARTVR